MSLRNSSRRDECVNYKSFTEVKDESTIYIQVCTKYTKRCSVYTTISPDSAFSAGGVMAFLNSAIKV